MVVLFSIEIVSLLGVMVCWFFWMDGIFGYYSGYFVSGLMLVDLVVKCLFNIVNDL